MSTVSLEEITGVLERIIYADEETHYCIGELRQEKKGANEKITITGNLPAVQCGETLILKGSWTNHAVYGKQFKIQQFESRLPSSVYGIRKYLGSGLVDGIGKTYAHKIVDHFGEDTFRIISEESARLLEIPGIGKTRAKAIKKAWEDQKAVRDVMIFLKTYGINNSQCNRLVQRFGNFTQEVIQKNPYHLIEEIKGIGFKTADKIALNLGFASDTSTRICSGILFALNEIEDNGHTAAPVERLLSYTEELLEVPRTTIEPMFQKLVSQREIILADSGLCQLESTFHTEQVLAENILRLARAQSGLPHIIVPKAVEWIQGHIGFSFAPEQIAGIERSLQHKLSIITGGPGTGKTTLLKALVTILKLKNVNITLGAPTGRAAQRMTETTGLNAQTIHRLLKYDPQLQQFVHNERNPMNVEFLIIDEASMLDSYLAASLFRALPNTAHVLLVGDIYQLPSVGPGKILQDLIESRLFNVTYLKHIFRQSDRSAIVLAAHDILSGEKQPPFLTSHFNKFQPSNDFHFFETQTPEDCVAKIEAFLEHHVAKHYPHVDILREFQILAPLYKGVAGITNLNRILQNVFKRKRAKGEQETKFEVGDKVIQLRNNYDLGVFNGDLGTVQKIDTQTGTLFVDFDHSIVEIDPTNAADLQLAYAISVHKSQGSEFPFVILPLVKAHFVMLQRNLLYTAITRARKKVFIFGDRMAYSMAVSNHESTVRQTALLQKIHSNKTRT